MRRAKGKPGNRGARQWKKWKQVGSSMMLAYTPETMYRFQYQTDYQVGMKMPDKISAVFSPGLTKTGR